MASKKLKVMALFDLPFAAPEDGDFEQFLDRDDWLDERNVIKAVRSLGYEVRVFGVYDNIQPLIDEITTHRPDVVFNMCETFNGSRDHEPNIAAILEILDVPYTGADTTALRLCKDKGLTKKILSPRCPRLIEPTCGIEFVLVPPPLLPAATLVGSIPSSSSSSSSSFPQFAVSANIAKIAKTAMNLKRKVVLITSPFNKYEQ